MTVIEAIKEIRRVGSIRAESGKLKIRFPEPERPRLETAFEMLRRDRLAALEVISADAAIPPSECWPESLRELADERAAASADPEAERRGVWLSWAEWKARELNRLFLEQGATGNLGNITAATIRRGDAGRLKSDAGAATTNLSGFRIKRPTSR